MANKTLIEELVTRFTADIKPLQEGGKKVESIVKNIKNGIEALGFGTLAYKTVSFMQNIVNSSVGMKRFSEAVQQSEATLFAWGKAIEEEGGTTDGFKQQILTLTNALNQPIIPADVIAGFSRYGIYVRDANGQVKDAITLYRELSNELKRYSLPQAMSIGKSLGLDEATVRLLYKGQKELDGIIDKYKRLSPYEKEQQERMEKLRRSWTELSAQWGETKQQIGVALIPFFDRLTDLLKDATDWTAEHPKATTLATYFLEAAVAVKAFMIVFSPVYSLLKGTWNIVKGLTKGLGKLISTLSIGTGKLVAFVKGIGAGPLAGLIAGFGAVGAGAVNEVQQVLTSSKMKDIQARSNLGLMTNEDLDYLFGLQHIWLQQALTHQDILNIIEENKRNAQIYGVDTLKNQNLLAGGANAYNMSQKSTTNNNSFNIQNVNITEAISNAKQMVSGIRDKVFNEAVVNQFEGAM